jgi:hypothetical protein
MLVRLRYEKILSTDAHCEGLVKVQVTDITAADRRVCQADLRVQVSAIQVDLTPVVVNDLASLATNVNSFREARHVSTHLLHAVLENTESRRVRDLQSLSEGKSGSMIWTDHERRELVLVLLSFRAKII